MRYLAPVILLTLVGGLSCLGPAAPAHAAGSAAVLVCQAERPAGPSTAVMPQGRVLPETGKTDPQERQKKTCSKTRYVNCMPPVPEARRAQCSRDYVEWLKENCPGAEVVY